MEAETCAVHRPRDLILHFQGRRWGAGGRGRWGPHLPPSLTHLRAPEPTVRPLHRELFLPYPPNPSTMTKGVLFLQVTPRTPALKSASAHRHPVSRTPFSSVHALSDLARKPCSRQLPHHPRGHRGASSWRLSVACGFGAAGVLFSYCNGTVTPCAPGSAEVPLNGNSVNGAHKDS